MWQALGIDCNVTFDARDLLSCVVALVVRAVCVFYALRINDQEARHGAASLYGTGRANLIFLRMV